MKRFVILAVAFAGSLLFSCGQPAKYIKHEGFTQGTYYRITYESPKGADYEKEIVQLLHDFSASKSTNWEYT